MNLYHLPTESFARGTIEPRARVAGAVLAFFFPWEANKKIPPKNGFFGGTKGVVERNAQSVRRFSVWRSSCQLARQSSPQK